MGKYIGKVSIANQSYYNYKPLGELDGTVINSLSENDIIKLLPKSTLENINFAYKPNDMEMSKMMEQIFPDGRLVVFEFEEKELEDNLTINGTRNPTGYKCHGIDFYKKGKIRSISTEGFYYLVDQNVLDSPLESGTSIITFSEDGIVEGDEILIRMRNGFYAGPYKVRLRGIDSKLYIKSNIKDNKYLIKGYSSKNCKKGELGSYDSSYDEEYKAFYSIKKGARYEVIDVISDEILLDYFVNSISLGEGKGIDEKNIDKIIAENRSSVFFDPIMTDDIREKRRNRLQELFTSHEYLQDTFSNISKCICDVLINYQSEDYVNNLLETLLKDHPDFADNVQNVRVLKEQVETTRNELSDLEEQKKSAENDLINIREQSRIDEEKQKKESLNKEIEEKLIELESLEKRIKTGNSLSEMEERLKAVKAEVVYREARKHDLDNDIKDVETRFQEVINRYGTKITDITVDGYVSNRMIEAAAQWGQRESNEKYRNIANAVKNIPSEDMSSEELVNYIVRNVQKVRPQYSHNLIVNITVCSVQGFLTVFSGAPGCGKTSMCNILARVLGLNELVYKLDNEDARRYISVSVERGWTSKRDLIGYYNPLTKSFEESNHSVFNGLQILDEEFRNNIKAFPFYILLDEANLSPMEYYWADFMNVCDDPEYNNTINLGNDKILHIPETLHFLATINNDHTTETLSPRLIDRAWVITLPKNNAVPAKQEEINEQDIRIVTWESIKRTFLIPADEHNQFAPEVNKIYENIRTHLNKMEINISPRVELAIHRYWEIASKLMKYDEEASVEPSIVALDYAVSQKILPKIMGSGEEYEEWLNDFVKIAKTGNLQMTASILEEIVRRGNKQLKYYQFFA